MFAATLVVVVETSRRLLRLLALLSQRRSWTGPELAARLGVTVRTVRRDVDRLRALDYPLRADLGVAGGYRLGPGGDLPPLVLEDDEAVATVVALRTASGSGVAELDRLAVSALAKIERVLPGRLRQRVRGLQLAVVPPMRDAAAPEVATGVLTAVSAACRDAATLRFDYAAADGTASRRSAEPHSLVSWGRRWYLVAWDVDRADWRRFRVDRMRLKDPGRRFTRRDLPGGDAAAFVTAGVAGSFPVRGRLLLHAPATAAELADASRYGTLTPVDAATCRYECGAPSTRELAFLLGALDVDFTVEDPPELAAELNRVADRFARAAAGGRAGEDTPGG